MRSLPRAGFSPAGRSFRELAAQIGIKSASIHHFPTKGNLGGTLARQYTIDFADYLNGPLATETAPDECIRKFCDVFRTTLLNENRMCLGGILSAEHEELPVEAQVELVKFGEMNVGWISRVLSLRPKAAGEPEAIQRRARAIFAAVQGAQLVARGNRSVAVYDQIIETYWAKGLLR